MYESDFVTEDIVELDIKDRPGFKFKPTTAGDENDWVDEYTEAKTVLDPETNEKFLRYVTNVSKLNICKMRNLVEVPYDDATLEKNSGVKKSWKQMSNDERWNVLRNLHPSVFNQILKAIKLVDSPKSTKN